MESIYKCKSCNTVEIMSIFGMAKQLMKVVKINTTTVIYTYQCMK